MVLTCADKEEIIEIIATILNQYLSESDVKKNISGFEKISTDTNNSLKELSERYDARISKLEKENISLHERLNDYVQHSECNNLRIFGVEEESNEEVNGVQRVVRSTEDLKKLSYWPDSFK